MWAIHLCWAFLCLACLAMDLCGVGFEEWSDIHRERVWSHIKGMSKIQIQENYIRMFLKSKNTIHNLWDVQMCHKELQVFCVFAHFTAASFTISHVNNKMQDRLATNAFPDTTLCWKDYFLPSIINCKKSD